mmetsp:Transcript_51456/g.142410  ORF Transcript_51456/g.142410 Transcript_51456/m.142410 type:complete len:291 (+) Transcript_51456:1271-2143(+)
MLARVHLLAKREVGDAFEDVLLRRGGLDLLHELVGFLHLVVVHVEDDQVEPRLGHVAHEGREHLQRTLALLEDDHVVADQVGLDLVDRDRLLGQRRELRLRRLAVVQPELVARLQVERDRRVRVRLQIGGKDLEGDVVVVELVVAEGDVAIERRVVAVLEQQPLVDVGGFLEVVAQKVDRRERELVEGCVRELLVVHHQLVLVVHPVRQVEEQPVLQRARRALHTLLLRLLEPTDTEQAAALVDMEHLVVGALVEQLLVRVERLLVVAKVERAVCQPHRALRILLHLLLC